MVGAIIWSVDDAERRALLEGFAGARAALQHARAGGAVPPAPAPLEVEPAEVERAEVPAADELGEAWSAEQLAARMAWGVERERLEQRVAELEREVAQLRTALGDVADAVARAVRPVGD